MNILDALVTVRAEEPFVVSVDSKTQSYAYPLWRKLYQDGSLSAVKAGEEVCAMSCWLT
ncbi:hypothetical protein [Burkholderia pseudomallei]|uniref:hypothetical protein n=1 Tax=Burkholderia pseudomallei TaxID=28450 RepID=UPI0013F17D16|nr:hypothetical protein [Burkholderia pseudomallei]